VIDGEYSLPRSRYNASQINFGACLCLFLLDPGRNRRRRCGSRRGSGRVGSPARRHCARQRRWRGRRSGPTQPAKARRGFPARDCLRCAGMNTCDIVGPSQGEADDQRAHVILPFVFPQRCACRKRPRECRGLQPTPFIIYRRLIVDIVDEWLSQPCVYCAYPVLCYDVIVWLRMVAAMALTRSTNFCNRGKGVASGSGESYCP